MADDKKKNGENKTTSKTVEKLVDEISKLSVMELADLVKVLQEKLGVSAAPVAATAATPVGGEAPAVAEQAASGGNQTLTMTDSGSNKIAVIKALREINQNLTLMDAKKMTEQVPAEILKDTKAEEVKAAADKLKAAGAQVEIK